MSDILTSLAIKDGYGVIQHTDVLEDAGGNYMPLVGIRSNSAAVATGNPLPVAIVGSFSLVNITTVGDGTVLTGGTAQALFSVTPTNLVSGAVPVNGWKIYNPNPTYDLWVSDTGTASINTCYRVPAGGGRYTTEIGEKPVGPLTIFSLLTGHPFIARRW